VAAGGLAALVALFALTVTETDEVFANAYSGAMSLQNVFPRAPQPLLVTGVAVAATVGALTIDLVSYQSFLLLLGSFFVPLFAVLLADWVLAGRHYDGEAVLRAPPLRPGALVAWLAGFAAYQWLYPTGPSWWVEQVERLDPPSWGIGATLPSFAAAFLTGLAAAALRRARLPRAASA
jgi:purine-cytosine permease-like protein